LARKRYMQRKTEIAEGRFFPNTRRRMLLFDDLVEDYRKATARRGKAIMRTDAGYRRALESFGGRGVETITAHEVEEWRDKLAESLSPASVAHYLTVLRAIFNRGVRDGKLQASPTRGVEWPEENNARVRWLTDDEENRLLPALAEWLRPLAIFAIHTGLRLGELLNLRWSDIDFGSGSLHVREAKSGVGRRLPLNQAALTILNDLRGAGAKVVRLETRRATSERVSCSGQTRRRCV
jgi:integrase